jgi:hypothetical protein
MAFILTNDHSTVNHSKLKLSCALDQGINVIAFGFWDEVCVA